MVAIQKYRCPPEKIRRLNDLCSTMDLQILRNNRRNYLIGHNENNEPLLYGRILSMDNERNWRVVRYLEYNELEPVERININSILQRAYK